MVRPRPRDDGQTWRTFIKNHSHELFACDFMTQYAALFATVYVFVVMEISTRRIVLCNVTESPTLDWVKIQIRNIPAIYGHRASTLLYRRSDSLELSRKETPHVVVESPTVPWDSWWRRRHRLRAGGGPAGGNLVVRGS
jgi:hypothetical protein